MDVRVFESWDYGMEAIATRQQKSAWPGEGSISRHIQEGVVVVCFPYGQLLLPYFEVI